MQSTHTPIDINTIDAEARQMRAEALRSLVISFRGAIAGLFVPKGHGASA